MDQKQLDAIRAIVEKQQSGLKSDRDAVLASMVPELLDYASRMKADMVSIRLFLMAFSDNPTTGKLAKLLAGIGFVVDQYTGDFDFENEAEG